MSHSGLSCLQGKVEADLTIEEEYVESNFRELASNWQKGDYASIINRCERLFSQNIFDIRVVTYYLYSAWVTPPRATLPEIFRLLNNLFVQEVDVWKPLSIAGNGNDTSEIQTILVQCLSLLFKKMEQRIKQYDEEFSQFEECSDSIVVELDKLVVYLLNYWEVNQLVYKINELKDCYFSNIKESGIKEPDLEESNPHLADKKYEEERQEVIIEGEASREKGSDRQSLESKTELARLSVELQSQAQSTSEETEPLNQLMNKIALFDQLIQRNDLLKAAIVAEDIQGEIEDFNPFYYLPSLFKRYAELRAVNLPQLDRHTAYQNTSHWQALKDYYVIDMAGFSKVNFKLNGNDEANKGEPANSQTIDEQQYSELYPVDTQYENVSPYTHGAKKPESMDFEQAGQEQSNG